MIKNCVKQLRKKHGFTLEALAEKVGVSHSHMQRIETHKTALSLELTERIADALQEDVIAVLGLSDGKTKSVAHSGSILSDAEPYKKGDDEFVMLAKGKPTLERWRILRPVLDKAGVPGGAVAYVDKAQRETTSVKPLMCVLAEVTGSERIVTRQFVPPGLLITNTTGTNEPSLDIDKGEAKIIGVLRGQFINLDS